jgi:hypothetical protein
LDRALVGRDRIDGMTGDQQTKIEQEKTKETKNSLGSNHPVNLSDSARLSGWSRHFPTRRSSIQKLAMTISW